MGLKELWKNVLEGDEEETVESAPAAPKEKAVEAKVEE